MRRIVHRILSGAPVTVAAYLAIWATAFPAMAAQKYLAFRGLLMSDARFFWLCLALITAYVFIWWMTSIEPKSRRKKIQEGLRPHYVKMSNAFDQLFLIETDGEWMGADEALKPVLQPCAQWISDNMGEAALTKFLRPQYETLVWTWDNGHDHDPEIKRARDGVINLQQARVEVLDTFLQNDGWDGLGLTNF